MSQVKTEQVNGRQCIGTNALVYCNTKYHRPYLARLDEQGEMDWQDREYVGYGKHSRAYYVVEALQPGDLIQCAGGSGGNKYPFKGRVVALTEDTLEVEEIDDKAWSNLLAERKNGDAEKAKLVEAERLASQLIALVGHDQAIELIQEVK